MSADVSKATNEFLVEELRADAKATEQAAEVQAALNPPAPEQAHGPMHGAPQAPQPPQIPPAQLKKLASALLVVCDRIIVGQAGEAYRLTKEEREEIAEAAAPVIQKYMPAAFGFLTTPEGVLLGTVAIIYGTKAGIDVMGLAGDAPTETPKQESNDGKEDAAHAG